MDDLGVEVLAGLIVLGIAALCGLAWNKREDLAIVLKRVVCRHQWEPMPPDSPVGAGGSEWCTKCDARR